MLNAVEDIQKTGEVIAEYTKTTDGKELSVDRYEADSYPNVLYLPLYTITAEEIFKGNILMFDVDFFNPKEVYIQESKEASGRKYELTEEGKKYRDKELPGMSDEDAAFHIALRYDLNNTVANNQKQQEMMDKNKITEEEFKKYLKEVPVKLSDQSNEELEEKNIEYYYYFDENGNIVRTSTQNTASALSGVISKWYNALRNIALVVMMSILLYIGIRMLISSISSDKAKYKQMLVDWLVGICLLFFMHYIMAFSITLVNQFVKIIGSIDGGKYEIVLEDDEKNFLSKGVKELGKGTSIQDGNIIWETNLMGKIRLAAEMRSGKVSFIGYAICFVVLVFYTVFFAFTYLKRVIYLAFLTIVAPLVAMTYPIDKLNDGQAQGFNKWLKEYIFNLLIQPLHLLLYTMLVSSVFSFASKNIWYMLVAIGFLIPAEKLLRSLFGFEKASTPASLAGAAVGAGLISRGVGNLLHKVPGGHDKQKVRDNGSKEVDNDSKSPRMALSDDVDSTASIMGGTGMLAGNEYANSNKKDEEALNKYRAKGFGQNAFGEYFNPYTSEYDSKYDPRKDSSYATRKLDNALPLKENQNKRKNIGTGKKRSLKRAIKAGGRRVFTRKNGRKLINMGKNIGKKGIRMATGAALGSVAGTIGVAAGIASGDISNVLQYGAAGIGAGAIAGSRLGGAVTNTIGSGYDRVKNSDTLQAMDRAYYGEEEYQQKQHDKQIKEWKRNIENKEKLENAIGEEQTKQMYEKGEIDEYLGHGISNVVDMATIHELQEKGIADNLDHAIAIHEYGERMGGDTSKIKGKDLKEWKETFSQEFKDRGYSEELSNQASEKNIKNIVEYHKMRNKIKKKL